VAPWFPPGLEGLDDDHGPAAVGAGLAERLWPGIGLVGGFVSRRLDLEQLADPGEVLGAAAVGKEAIMADAVEA
jgi:hypothetical protein